MFIFRKACQKTCLGQGDPKGKPTRYPTERKMNGGFKCHISMLSHFMLIETLFAAKSISNNSLSLSCLLCFVQKKKGLIFGQLRRQRAYSYWLCVQFLYMRIEANMLALHPQHRCMPNMLVSFGQYVKH